jgi:hypothetical protein
VKQNKNWFIYTANAAPYDFDFIEAGGVKRLVDWSSYEVEPETHFNGVADMRFILFTRSNPNEGQVLTLNNVASVVASHFNPAHPTRCVTQCKLELQNN